MKIKSLGFTLVELMIVVAIVGILAAIAIPSYQDSVRKSRRADAKAVLQGLAGAMKRRFTETNNYCNVGSPANGGANSCGDSDTTEDTGTPTIYAVPTQISPYYTITISSATQYTFTLSAEPINAQADDSCGTLTIDNADHKDAVANGASVASSCW